MSEKDEKEMKKSDTSESTEWENGMPRKVSVAKRSLEIEPYAPQKNMVLNMMKKSFDGQRLSFEGLDRSSSYLSQIFSRSLSLDTLEEDEEFCLNSHSLKLSREHGSWKGKEDEDNDSLQLEKNTTCFGLTFKNWMVEKTFMNEYAVLHKRTVYAGYIIQLLSGILLILLAILFNVFRQDLCEHGEACSVLFGPPIPLEVGTQMFGSINSLISIFGVVLILLGGLLHYYIHGSSSIKNKVWALVSNNVIYMLELTVLIANLTFNHSLGDMDKFWGLRLFLWYLVIIMISVYFTGFLFKQNALNFVFATSLFYGLSLPIAVGDYNIIGNKINGTSGAVFAFAIYLTTAPITTILHVLMLVSSYIMEKAARRRFVRKLMITHQQDKILREKTRNESLQRELLDNILPPMIVDSVTSFGSSKDTLRSLSQRHQGVSIMFADIAGFTSFATQVDSSTVMIFLNEIFQKFDDLCDQLNVYKIETVGDCYVAAVGIITGQMMCKKFPIVRSKDTRISECKMFHGCTEQDEEAKEVQYIAECNTEDMVNFAKAIIRASRNVTKPKVQQPALIRVGIHTGPCMSGIVGTKNMRYCLFGDTMNTAARMEQNGVVDAIHASELVAGYTPHEHWEERGTQFVKGKGDMKTYTLVPT